MLFTKPFTEIYYKRFCLPHWPITTPFVMTEKRLLHPISLSELNILGVMILFTTYTFIYHFY
jgi:hypothetical protein